MLGRPKIEQLIRPGQDAVGAGITVSARGTATGTPDRAVISLGSSAVRPTVAEALAEVDARVTALLAAVTAHGIEGPSVQTTEFSIWPEHGPDGSVRGFRVRNTLKVEVAAIGQAGEVLTAATTALGNTAEIYGLAFEVADESGLEETARQQAYHLAHAKAVQLAGLAGVSLGHPVEIVETAGTPMAGVRYRMAAAAEAAPIEAGSARVDVHLTVRFALTG
ncbi:MAG TPA: SIMPL domain-containing protein [Acidimicrobiia bacterium]|nr:SIMPL domain-containing protein [Acidimicrobiia bacterium]